MLLLRFYSARLWPSLCCCVLFTAAFLLKSFNPLPLLVVLAPFILFIVRFFLQLKVMAPVLLAEYGVEERKRGKGGRGGAHPVRLSELPMKFLPNHLFAPAPIMLLL